LKVINEVTDTNPDGRWLWTATLPIFLALEDYAPDEDQIRELGVPEDMLPAVKALLANPSDEQAIEQLKVRFSEGYIKNAQFTDRSPYMARQLLAYAGKSDYVLDVDMAVIHIRPHGIEEWAWTPAFNSIRENPRFQEYLEKAGIIEYWDTTEWPAWCERKNDGRIECQ